MSLSIPSRYTPAYISSYVLGTGLDAESTTNNLTTPPAAQTETVEGRPSYTEIRVTE